MVDTIVSENRYANVPEPLALDYRLSDRALRLWVRLDRFAGSKDSSFPLRSTLADELDCSVPTIDRALRELEDTGWLRKERKYAGGSNTYTLVHNQPKATLKLIAAAVKAKADARKNRPVAAGDTIAREQGDDASVNDSENQASPQVSAGGAITSDATPPAITSDARVQSPVMRPAITGDAYKEASLKEASTKDTLFAPSPQADGPDGSVTADAETEGNGEPPELTLIEEPIVSAGPGPSFNDFYETYPRKVAPQKAREAWNKAVRGGADPAAIVAGAERVASQPDLPDRKDKQRWSKIPHPASWLNGGRWKDEEPLFFGYSDSRGRSPAYNDEAMWGTVEDRRAEHEAQMSMTPEEVQAASDAAFADTRKRPTRTVDDILNGDSDGEYGATGTVW